MAEFQGSPARARGDTAWPPRSVAANGKGRTRRPLNVVHAPPASAGGARLHASLPWQDLYFLPLPQGHGSLRPTRGTSVAKVAGSVSALTLPSSFGWV